MFTVRVPQSKSKILASAAPIVTIKKRKRSSEAFEGEFTQIKNDHTAVHELLILDCVWNVFSEKKRADWNSLMMAVLLFSG